MQVEGVLQWVKENWGKSYMPSLLRKIEEQVWKHVDAMFCVSENC